MDFYRYIQDQRWRRTAGPYTHAEKDENFLGELHEKQGKVGMDSQAVIGILLGKLHNHDNCEPKPTPKDTKKMALPLSLQLPGR